MKKEEIIEILKNKGNKTYLELAKLTGYHEKSLIRITTIEFIENYTFGYNDICGSPGQRGGSIGILNSRRPARAGRRQGCGGDRPRCDRSGGCRRPAVCKPSDARAEVS